MIRFVNFLKDLGKHAGELKARFDSVHEQLVERMRTADGRASLRWTLRSQLDEYDWWPEPDAMYVVSPFARLCIHLTAAGSSSSPSPTAISHPTGAIYATTA